MIMAKVQIVLNGQVLNNQSNSCHPWATDKKSFMTYGLGSSLQILVANWKKYPCQFHWQRGF